MKVQWAIRQCCPITLRPAVRQSYESSKKPRLRASLDPCEEMMSGQKTEKREAIDKRRRVHYIETREGGRETEGAPETRQWNLIGKRTRREFYAGQSKSKVKGYFSSDFQSCAEKCTSEF